MIWLLLRGRSSADSSKHSSKESLRTALTTLCQLQCVAGVWECVCRVQHAAKVQRHHNWLSCRHSTTIMQQPDTVKLLVVNFSSLMLSEGVAVGRTTSAMQSCFSYTGGNLSAHASAHAAFRLVSPLVCGSMISQVVCVDGVLL